MRNLAVIGVFLLLVSGATDAGQPLPPVGYDALSGPDHLWIQTGKAFAGMSASTDPTHANMDMSQFHGEYRGEKVLARLDGPGCIYRIWSAWPSGTVKFYFDGEKKPRMKCNFRKFLEGQCDGLPGQFSVGRTAYYMPIPFEKSIIVTTSRFHFPGYYQVVYQLYDGSVEVGSFDPKKANSGESLERALDFWATFPSPPAEGSTVEEGSVSIEPGASAVAFDLTGTGIIRYLEISDADGGEARFEGLDIKMFWDGEAEPSVNCPIDAFFINRFDMDRHWPAGVLTSMFVSAGKNLYATSFPMPFSKSASIRVVNDGPVARNVRIKVAWEDWDALPPGAMRFHASYNSRDYETEVTEKNTLTNKDPVDQSRRYVVLHTEGRGNYVGCALFVEHVGSLWWGEGDEMTYIDGAETPQIYGTGTEDEFNWSWGFMPHMSPVSGTLPVIPDCGESLAAQIIPALRKPECMNIEGKSVAYRFRPSDYVPFDKSIEVSYEVLGQSWEHPHPSLPTGNITQYRGDDFSSVAYWYEMP